jgi:LacI family transcriptional regulator
MAFAAYRTDAIILVGSRGAHSDAALHRTLARYLENSGRVVAFGSAGPPGARLLELGNREGSRRLAEALIDRGVRRFAILGGPPDLVTSRDRVAGFQQAINGRRLRAAPVVHGDFTSEGGHAAARAAWDLLDHHRGSCLLAVNDVMALGAITALRSNGLRVPDDVQVAGFDDIPTLRDHDPPLTTFRLPLEAIGEQAAALALSSDGTTHLRIDGEVVLRASAGRADS